MVCGLVALTRLEREADPWRRRFGASSKQVVGVTAQSVQLAPFWLNTDLLAAADIAGEGSIIIETIMSVSPSKAFRFPVYQIDFSAVASGKRVAATKRRIRWYVRARISSMRFAIYIRTRRCRIQVGCRQRHF
jgi:hypothetical protein